MFYHLFEWLRTEGYRFPGVSLFQFITFRVLVAVILSLVISTVFGRKIIRYLQRLQIGESVRELGLEGEKQKKGTPTMGGLIIILAILIPTLLLANLGEVYIRLMIFSTLWLGFIGFMDDYFKLRAKRRAQLKGEIFKKGDDDGLAAKSKIIGQVVLGVIVGATLYFSPSVEIWREYQGVPQSNIHTHEIVNRAGDTINYVAAKDGWITTIPFVKTHEFNYAKLLPASLRDYTWLLFILIVIFIITAVSNGANITDGLDGLATGTSAIIGLCLGIFSYASGNFILAEYLNIMYIPHLGELSIFIGAMIGACIGFLWYNSYPAQIFMGDTGSLMLGGVIAALAIIVHKELLIPIFCFVFLVENLSVMLQVGYFKYTKKRFGQGKRIFLMSPLHHHYQKKGLHEAKIAIRFWIITVLAVILSIVTLKLR